MSMATVASKACTHCGETKPLTEFSPKPRNYDGRGSWCKSCVRSWVRRYRAENPSVRARGDRQQKAYQAAVRRLRDNHRDEFDRLYAEELAMRGMS